MPPITRSAGVRLVRVSRSSPADFVEEASQALNLLALPTDLMVLVLLSLPTRDMGRVDQLCHAFHSAAAGAASVVEDALQRRATAGVLAKPMGKHVEASTVQLLMWLERRGRRDATHLVACGQRHAVMVDAYGRVWTCGAPMAEFAAASEFPAGPAGGVQTWLPVLSGVRVVSVAAGYAHTVAVTEAGHLFSWGCGDDGRLGLGDEEKRLAPVLVELPHIKGATAGYDTTAAYTDDGRLFDWGGGVLTPRVEPTLEDVKVVDAAFGYHCQLAVDEDGRVYSWGLCGHDNLGHGDGRHQVIPKQIEALAAVEVVRVSCGFRHCLATTAAGDVYSWGAGFFGALGHGDGLDQPTPKRIESLPPMAHATAGRSHSLATDPSGMMYSWGRGQGGSLASRQLAPEPIGYFPPQYCPTGSMKVLTATAGALGNIAMTAKGEVWRWGHISDTNQSFYFASAPGWIPY